MIRELIWRLAMTGAGTLVLAAVIFCTVPRLGRRCLAPRQSRRGRLSASAMQSPSGNWAASWRVAST